MIQNKNKNKKEKENLKLLKQFNKELTKEFNSKRSKNIMFWSLKDCKERKD